MLTGTIRTQIDQIWNAFWSGGVSNPLSVIEQLTFLLFIKRLDELHTNEENKAEMLGIDMERRIFPEGHDDKGEPYDNLRWSRFKNFEAREMMRIVDEHVFPFLRQLGEEPRVNGSPSRGDAAANSMVACRRDLSRSKARCGSRPRTEDARWHAGAGKLLEDEADLSRQYRARVGGV